MRMRVIVGFYDALVDGGDGQTIHTRVVETRNTNVGEGLAEAVEQINRQEPAAHGNAFVHTYCFTTESIESADVAEDDIQRLRDAYTIANDPDLMFLEE